MRNLACHYVRTLTCGCRRQRRSRTGAAARARLVTANPIGDHARGALEGLRRGRSVGILGRAGPGCPACDLAVVGTPAIRLRGAGLQTSGRSALEGAAVLRRRGGARALAVARRRGCEDADVARGCLAHVAAAHLAARARAVAGAVVSALVGGRLVHAGLVGVQASQRRGTGAVTLPGQRVRAGIAASAGGCATNSVDAVAQSAVAGKRARRSHLSRQLLVDRGIDSKDQSLYETLKRMRSFRKGAVVG